MLKEWNTRPPAPVRVQLPDRRILLLVGARNEERNRGSVPGRLLVVDADRGEIVAAAGHAEVMPFSVQIRSSHQIAWSPDGTRFTVTRNSDSPLRQARRGTVSVTVYEAATARPVASMDLPTAPDGLPMTHVGLAFSPDGRRLAAVAAPTQYEGHVRVWDATTGKELLVLHPPRLPGRLGFSASTNWRELTFSPDGTRLLLAESRPPTSAADRTRSAYLVAWDATPRPEPKK